jgi:hypothetical protein
MTAKNTNSEITIYIARAINLENKNEILLKNPRL